MEDQLNQRPRKKYAAYRFLGFINNFMAVFFLFVTMMSVAAMGFQSAILLYLFVFISILIYTNLTTVFARHVLVRGNYLRKKLKDWIKVNAYVAIIFGTFMIVSILFILSSPAYMDKIKQLYSGMEGMTDQMMESVVPMIRGVLIGFLVSMLCIVVHVFMTFKYLKEFKDHFKEQPVS